MVKWENELFHLVPNQETALIKVLLVLSLSIELHCCGLRNIMRVTSVFFNAECILEALMM